MWQVTGFAPNTFDIDTKIGIVSSDSKGRIKTCQFKERFDKRLVTAYYLGDEGYNERLDRVSPIVKGQFPEKGDWILGRGGIVCKLLDTVAIRTGNTGGWSLLGYTIFGTNCYNYQPVELLMDRVSFGSLSTMRTGGITRFTKSKAELVAAYVLNNFDAYAAYESSYGQVIDTPNRKAYAKTVIKKALASPEGSRYLLETIRERLTKTGIDGGQWVQKLIDSVPGAIENETQRKIWEMVGMLEPAIRQQILEARGEIDPNGGVQPFQIPGGQEQIAEFTECQVCHGTKEIIVENERKIKFKAICPACRPKAEVPVQPVQRSNQKLKL